MCWIVAITVGHVRSGNFSNASETPAAVWGGVSRLPGVSAARRIDDAVQSQPTAASLFTIYLVDAVFLNIHRTNPHP